MRIVVSHEGFITGQPPRYRHVGEMRVTMETSVDFDTVELHDAPLAYTLENPSISSVTEYRFHDGAYLTPLPWGDRLLAKATRGPVALTDFELDPLLENIVGDYRQACEWRKYASRGIGSKGELAAARQLHEWNAIEVDDSDAPVFEQAVRDVLKTLVFVDGKLWCRCFEPCLIVWWITRLSGAMSVGIAPADIRNLHGRLGHPETDDFGLKTIRPNVYMREGVSTSLNHERCFAVAEADRIVEFVNTLTAKAKASSSQVNIDVSSPRTLRVVDADLCSKSFDELELGRSARTYTAAWDAMRSGLQRATGNKWKKVINFQEFDTRASEVEFALRDLERGSGSPEEVLEAMKSLADGLDFVISSSIRKLKVDLEPLRVPRYCGDPDNMVVGLDVSARSLGAV